MGKTAQGAVWLNEEMLSPYDYWQFWRNSEDADVGRFLKFFSELPMDEIARLEKLQGAELNTAKKILATEATALAHGRAAAEQAEKTAGEVFETGVSSAGLPTVEIDAKILRGGLGLLTAFVQAGLASSNSEARRLVQGGGGKVNDVIQTDIAATLSDSDLQDGVIKLSAGKKRHVLLKPRG